MGTHPREARSILGDAGFEMIVHRVPGRGCDITPRVVEQHVPDRHAEPAQVWVRVDALACGLTAALRKVAERFIGFARRDIERAPADAPVDLYVGGRFATTIETHHLDDPDAW